MRLPAGSLRYLAVGGACTGANNVILIGGAAAGLHYSLCIVLATSVVLPASYFAHAGWTFGTTMSGAGFRRYLLGSLSSVTIAIISLWVLCGPLGLPMPVAAPTATIAMIFFNYVMTRWAVRQPEHAGTGG